MMEYTLQMGGFSPWVRVRSPNIMDLIAGAAHAPSIRLLISHT